MINKINFQIISLDNQPDRYESFLLRNLRQDCSFIKFSALDGKALNRDYLIDKGVISCELDYQTGALGCAMSHLSLWNLAIQTNSIIHIAEDDAVFRNDLSQVMLQMLESPLAKDFDLIYWGYNRDLNFEFDILGLGNCMVVMNEKVIKNEDNLLDFQSSLSQVFLAKSKRVFGALCYSISPKGAEKLISLGLPLRPMTIDVALGDGLGGNRDLIFRNVGIDNLMGVLLQAQLNSLMVFPPLAVSLNIQGPPSTTQTNDWVLSG